MNHYAEALEWMAQITKDDAPALAIAFAKRHPADFVRVCEQLKPTLQVNTTLEVSAEALRNWQ